MPELRSLVTVEGSRGREGRRDDKKDGDRCMTGDSASVSPTGAFVKVQEDFAYGAEIEAAGETLRGEGVTSRRDAILTVEADGEEQRESEIEDVGPA